MLHLGRMGFNRLEEIYREDVGPHLAELAHHFREAGLAEKAIDYSFRAGRAAASVFAFTDAMMHWQAALDLMERHALDTLRRADLLQGLARVAFEVDRAMSLRYGESAIALYESLRLMGFQVVGEQNLRRIAHDHVPPASRLR